MANVTRATLAAERDSNFPTNNTNQITAVDLRDWLTDGIDSFLTQKDKSIMEEVIWEARSNALTAGATTDLSSANGNFVHIQGSTTTINSFGICNSGARFILVFDGVYTLDYDATQLILPGSSNITTAANDCCMIVSEGSGNWRVIGYFPIAGGSGGGTVTAVTASSPLSSTGGNAPDISIQQATTSQNGYLTSTDWNTFNGKQDALSAGTGISLASNTVTNTAPDQTVALTPGTGIGITGTYPNFTIANTSPSSGGTITALTNDVTASGSGSVVATIANDAVTYAKMQNVSTNNRLLGRASAGAGDVEEITLGTNLSFSGTTLNASGSGSGTVNSGTANRLTYYAATGTAVSELPTAGSAGQILQSNGTASAPSWVNAPAATLTIGTSIVSGATAGRVLLTTTSGGNQVLNQDSNLNYDTTNDRLGIGVASPAARVDLAAGTAANGQILLAPSTLGSAGLTGTTDGTMWYDTTSNNSSIYLRKLYAAATSILTKLITLDRNPDLAIGSTNGVVISDANGSLSKSADLTALGIYAQTNDVTVVNTTTATTIIGTVTGSATLPANFFGVGKTIIIFVSGTYAQTSGSNTCTLNFSIGGVAIGSIALQHGNSLSNTYFEARIVATCRTAGASGTVQYQGCGLLNLAGTPEFYYITPATSGSINTTTTNAINVTATWLAANPSNSLVVGIHTAQYIN